MRELNYEWVKSTASSRTPTLAKCFAKQHVGSLLHRPSSVRSDAEKRLESGQERAVRPEVAGAKHAASH